MKRVTRILLLAVMCGLLAGGCATSAMKGTPFYTGEYEKRMGDPGDRKNIWPLVYYRDPALSVLWPFIELSDEHFAVRPVMSVHGLGTDKKICNVLWPLGKINQRTGNHRFFPVFWGDDYCHVFPLYTHIGGKGTTTDTLFPLWMVRGNGEKYSNYFAWPVFHFKDWGEREGWRVWPVAGHYRNYSKHYSFYAWPLGHAWRNEAADRVGSALFPVYCYKRDKESREFFSLPYSFARGGTKEWDCGFPLFYRESSEDGSKFVSLIYLAGDNRSADRRWRCLVPVFYSEKSAASSMFVSPLYMSGDDKRADSSWQCLIPAYYRSRKGEDAHFGTLLGGWAKKGDARGWAAVPALSWGEYSGDKGYFVAGGILGHGSWDGDDGSSHVLPLYYRRKSGDRSVFVSLPYSSGSTRNSSWKLVPPVCFALENEKIKTLVTPLYARGQVLTKDASWSALMPFYYRYGDPNTSAVFTLPLAWGRDGSKRIWMSLPLLSGSVSDGEEGETWLLGPIYHKKWDRDGAKQHLLPVYYRDSKTGTFVSLAYSSWKSDDGRTTRVIPPVLGAMTSGNNRNDLWALAGLAHASWGEGDTPHHFIPFYYSDPASSRFFSLPYSSWKTHDGRTTRVIPPALGAMTSGNDRNDLWALAGLAHASWGEGDTPHHFIPLYYSDPGSGRFLSLPYCSKTSEGRVTRVVPPLLSSYERRGERKQVNALLGLSSHQWGGKQAKEGYLFPLYGYQGKRHFYTPVFGWKNSESDGFVYPLTPFLGIRKGENKGGWLFPLFSYKKDKKENISGTYLWGGYWKNERNSGSGIFPIYHYKNHGSIDGPKESREAYSVAGKEFISLPFCWYRNKVHTRPVYAKGKMTGRLSRTARKSNGFFPVWSYKARENLESGRIDSGGSLLLWLFDSKYEKRPETDHEYVRKRVLWRVYHYEKLNGDVSVDAFPFITYDKRTDGRKSFSFMWRLFSYQRKKEGLKVHILFIPFGKGK